MLVWWLVLAASALFFAYVYGGFSLLLRIVRRPLPMRDTRLDAAVVGVTVYVSALNEADTIAGRIANLVDTDHPLDRMEVLIVSDGSSDGTAAVARAAAADLPAGLVRVEELTTPSGRASAQNLVAHVARFDVLVATDAETVFTRSTLPRLVAPFSDPRVGVVGGVVHYTAGEATHISTGYRRYRSVEQRLRKIESDRGLLIKTDGPCTAYRRGVWSDLEAFEDVDQVIVLLARKHGLLAVQAEGATAIEVANARPMQDVRQRSRMTRKALLSTFHRWRWRDSLRDPVFAWVLWSHKLLRFFSPLALLAMLVAAVGLVVASSSASLVGGTALAVVLVFGALTVTLRGSAVPPLRLLNAFLVAQVGFALGIVGFLRRDGAGSYTPTRVLKR